MSRSCICAPGLAAAVIALAPLGALADGLAAQTPIIEGPSREARSLRYCSIVANVAGFYDTDRALACRREEYTAAARARALAVPAEIDFYCASLAGEGDRIGPFSWHAYLDCVDDLLP